MSRPDTLTFFYSLRSPYAWLAWRLLHEHLPPAALERIEFVPFWEPEPTLLRQLEDAGAGVLYRPMPRERHFYILADVRRLARHLGYQVRWPGETQAGRWDLPHLACLSLAQQPAASALIDRLFSARWEQGRDICDPAVLDAELAELDLSLRSEHLAHPALRLQAVDALKRAHASQVFGVPFFVSGRERYWGVDRLPFALAGAGLPSEALATAWMHGHSSSGGEQVTPC